MLAWLQIGGAVVVKPGIVFGWEEACLKISGMLRNKASKRKAQVCLDRRMR
jgi:hypothetical protein